MQTITLTRLDRDYVSRPGVKILCRYFVLSRFRVRAKAITVTFSTRELHRSKRIALLLKGTAFMWVDGKKTLTLHDGLQPILKRAKAKSWIFVRVKPYEQEEPK